MAEDIEPDRCAALLKALADPTRLRIVEALCDGPKNVSDVATLLEIDLANVSHHLRALRSAGLVHTEREGKFVYYSLDASVIGSHGNLHPDRLDFGCCRIELGKQAAGEAP